MSSPRLTVRLASSPPPWPYRSGAAAAASRSGPATLSRGCELSGHGCARASYGGISGRAGPGRVLGDVTWRRSAPGGSSPSAALSSTPPRLPSPRPKQRERAEPRPPRHCELPPISLPLAARAGHDASAGRRLRGPEEGRGAWRAAADSLSPLRPHPAPPGPGPCHLASIPAPPCTHPYLGAPAPLVPLNPPRPPHAPLSGWYSDSNRADRISARITSSDPRICPRRRACRGRVHRVTARPLRDLRAAARPAAREPVVAQAESGRCKQAPV